MIDSLNLCSTSMTTETLYKIRFFFVRSGKTTDDKDKMHTRRNSIIWFWTFVTTQYTAFPALRDQQQLLMNNAQNSA